MRTDTVLDFEQNDRVHETPARLLRLLSLLHTRVQWTGPELAGRLEVTTRTVRRDVDRLRSLGYLIDSTPGPTGAYRLAPGGTLPPLPLDDDEAVAVAVSLRTAAGGSVAGVDEAALTALAKLERVLPARLRSRVLAVGAATVALTSAEAKVDADALVTIAQACQGSERLRFMYRDRSSHQSERTVEPHRLVHTGRRWYLVARDVRRDDWRTFRADRVTDIVATGHRFVFDDPPDAAALVSRGVSVAPYRHQARVIVKAAAAVVAENVPPTVGVVTALDDATCELSTGADHLDAIAAHLLLLDADFVVLDPPELRDRIAVLADRLTRATS
jgi:predicted DNA-binding transcriptional regulator YafY